MRRQCFSTGRNNPLFEENASALDSDIYHITVALPRPTPTSSLRHFVQHICSKPCSPSFHSFRCSSPAISRRPHSPNRRSHPCKKSPAAFLQAIIVFNSSPP